MLLCVCVCVEDDDTMKGSPPLSSLGCSEKGTKDILEQAKEELQILEAQQPDRFNYLKLELKSFISFLESHSLILSENKCVKVLTWAADSTSVSLSSSATTQGLCLFLISSLQIFFFFFFSLSSFVLTSWIVLLVVYSIVNPNHGTGLQVQLVNAVFQLYHSLPVRGGQNLHIRASLNCRRVLAIQCCKLHFNYRCINSYSLMSKIITSQMNISRSLSFVVHIRDC